MVKPVDSEFGPFRSIFWPIHRHELGKLMPMLIMLFLICFNYSILRNMKDSVIITASGAEVIPFIKVWVLFPMAVAITLLFTKLSSIFSQERVFYMMLTGFLILYALFAFVLYPNRDALHPNATADWLATILPMGFKGLIEMFRNWTLTSFYVFSELWSTMIMTVIFWGFANEVTHITEARRFYGVFGIGANFAAIAAGQVSILFASDWLNQFSLHLSSDPWEQTTQGLILLVIVSGLLTMALFRWLNRNVLTDPSFNEFHQNKRERKAKGRLSLKESFSYLSNSSYLVCIAVLVVGYNLGINLVEVVWKDQLRVLYPAPVDYNNYINNLTSIMGVFSTISAFFMARLIGRMGWSWTALITPITMLVTSVGFFLFMFFQEHLSSAFMTLIGMTPLAIAVFFGSAQNTLCKAAKYSFFDTTKEMAFIPLDHESKLKGKAAIDGVGSRLGKSGGSLIHQGLLMIFGSLAASAPYVAAILLGAIAVWVVAARSLGRKFTALIAKQGATDIPLEGAEALTAAKPQAAS